MLKIRDFLQLMDSPQGFELIFPEPVEVAQIKFIIPWWTDRHNLFNCPTGTSNCDWR